jgi:acetyl-CoA acetyltransferase
MRFDNAFIPYGAYWSTPFVKWQGSFATLHPLKFAAETARRALGERGLEPASFDALFLGTTVPSPGVFYGAPWVAAALGAPDLTGPMFGQACATSARVIGSAAAEAQASGGAILCLTADRTSNGPHLLYPNPLAPGGRGEAEDWVWDNFNRDPWAGQAMIQTAENVAVKAGISTEAQHEVVLLRHAQYQEALAGEAAFQRRYMVTPIEVKDPSGRKTLATVTSDEGVFPTTAEGLARLKPALPGGTVTFGGQTYPADGNAGLVVAARDRAREYARDPGIEAQVLAFAQSRVEKAHMPMAPVPAARRALAEAGLDFGDLRAVKTHNPFAVNDVYFSRETGVRLEAMNCYGCSLIYGHPQGPTGMRLVIELIEELAKAGGGYGLFVGCAAGDTAAALVVRVAEAKQ